MTRLAQFFKHGEDMERCYRLKLAGWRVVYTPQVTIVHDQGENMCQQRCEVLLAGMKGPRQFYLQMSGGRSTHAYDAITIVGFGLHWFLYRLGALLLGYDTFHTKAKSSRDLMRRAWLVMRA